MKAGFALGWRQVGACLVLLAATGMIASTYSIVAVPLAQEFRPSRMVLMLAMTVMSAGTALLSPLLGNVMDRWSMRLMMLSGAALLSAGFLALSFVTSFVQVLVVYAVLMAPVSILLGPIAASVLLSRWFVKRRGSAIGIAVAGVSLGTFIFPPIIQGLLDAFAWREAVRWLALLLFVITVPAALAVVNRPGDRGVQPDGAGTGAAGQPTPAPSVPPLPARAILTDSTFWLAVLLFAVVLAGMKGMVTNLAPLAIDQDIAPSDAALLISIFAAGGFVSKIVFAAVADRVNLRVLLAAAVLGFAAGIACLIRAEAGYLTIAAGVSLIGLFGGFMVPLQGLLIPRVFGVEVVGRVSGLLNLFVLCVLLASPPLFGLAFDLTGNYDTIFVAFAVLAVGVALLVPLIRVQPKAPAAAPPRPEEIADEVVLAQQTGA